MAFGPNQPESVSLSTPAESADFRNRPHSLSIFLNCRLTRSFRNAANPAWVPIARSRIALIGQPTSPVSSYSGACVRMWLKSLSIWSTVLTCGLSVGVGLRGVCVSMNANSM
jgi:hypothetical protein